jgi:hypothetical protein
MRFLLALFLCFIFTTAQAATIDLDYSKKKVVDNDSTITKIYYSSTDSVTMGTDQVFKILVNSGRGGIKNVAFESSSPDLMIWISETENATSVDVSTFILLDIDTLGYSTEFASNVYYYNGDTVHIEYLYFTISNQSATVTGSWELTLTVDSN